MNLPHSLVFCIGFGLFVEQSLKCKISVYFYYSLFGEGVKMRIVAVLIVFLLAKSIIIHADKEYSCSHVNATFGVPVGSVSRGFL